MAAPGQSGRAQSDGVIRWRFAPFEELTTREVHDLLQLRAEVFVVEQDCPFQDMDGVDPDSWHLLGRRGDVLIAYCRMIPAGIKFAEPSIGRVVTPPALRRTGCGRELMAEALRRADTLWPGRSIRIGAQHRLERFYEDFGFATASEPYIEDGIPHIEMLRPASGMLETTGRKAAQE
jgi:ElaA protein